MAIINSSAIGKATGSLGNLTYSTQQGRTIARDRVRTVHNPNTMLQQAQRSKMRDVVLAWSLIGNDVKKLFTKRKKYSSAYNAFVSANIADIERFVYDAEARTASFGNGFIFGVGQYPSNTLSITTDEPNEAEIITTSRALISQMKIGDTIGVVGLLRDTSGIEMIERKLTADDIDSEAGSLSLSLTLGGEKSLLYIPYYLSSDGKISVSCEVKL